MIIIRIQEVFFPVAEISVLKACVVNVLFNVNRNSTIKFDCAVGPRGGGHMIEFY
jgi:hypothetical protein